MSSTKRKSDAKAPAGSKKARLDPHAAARQTVQSVVANPDDFLLPESRDAVQNLLVAVVLYARSLEEEIQASKPKAKSQEELNAAAEKLRNAARSGIRKQMTWKLSCKTGSARWVYDGVCADPEAFGAFLGLDGAPTFKTKKIPKDEFQELIGDLQVSIRYDTLAPTSDINVHWKPAEGTFKLSGSYGKLKY